MAHRIGVARDAERQQHQQEIAQTVEALRLSEALALNVAVQCNQQTHRNAALLNTVAQHQQTIQQQAAQIDILKQLLHEARSQASLLSTAKAEIIDAQAEQIETLTQALKGVKSIQRGYLCWCDGSWNNVEHGHQPKCQKATEAISGASRPTEGEQGAKP